MAGKGRVVVEPHPVDGAPQLQISLAQPVDDGLGGMAGVFGADLLLQPLADLLRI